MLLQLENTNKENISKLIDYAKKLNINLSLVDEDNSNYALPGKPLDDAQLKKLIESSRNSGTISLNDAHAIIRKNFNAD